MAQQRLQQLNLIKKRKRTQGVKWGRPITTHTGARQTRESFSSRHPLHITLRLREGLPSLRTKRGFEIVSNAIVGAQKSGIRVIHFAVLSNHIHMIIEGKNSETLFNSMKSFCSRLGIAIRKWGEMDVIKKLDKKRLGLFLGRYHIQVIKTPLQMKNVLKYVLLNPAKHFKKAPYIDVLTSGALFSKWKLLVGTDLKRPNVFLQWREQIKNYLSPPSLWLTEIGWTKGHT